MESLLQYLPGEKNLFMSAFFGLKSRIDGFLIFDLIHSLKFKICNPIHYVLMPWVPTKRQFSVQLYYYK